MTQKLYFYFIVLKHLMFRIYETLFTIARIFNLFYYQRHYKVQGIEKTNTWHIGQQI